MGPDIEERGTDLLTPVYNMLDLTPGAAESSMAS